MCTSARVSTCRHAYHFPLTYVAHMQLGVVAGGVITVVIVGTSQPARDSTRPIMGNAAVWRNRKRLLSSTIGCFLAAKEIYLSGESTVVLFPQPPKERKEYITRGAFCRSGSHSESRWHVAFIVPSTSFFIVVGSLTPCSAVHFFSCTLC